MHTKSSPSPLSTSPVPQQWGSVVLILGAIGLVNGDICTSPIYASREVLAQTGADGISRPEILDVLSLALWALIIVVTPAHACALRCHSFEIDDGGRFHRDAHKGAQDSLGHGGTAQLVGVSR